MLRVTVIKPIIFLVLSQDFRRMGWTSVIKILRIQSLVVIRLFRRSRLQLLRIFLNCNFQWRSVFFDFFDFYYELIKLRKKGRSAVYRSLGRRLRSREWERSQYFVWKKEGAVRDEGIGDLRKIFSNSKFAFFLDNKESLENLSIMFLSKSRLLEDDKLHSQSRALLFAASFSPLNVWKICFVNL